MTDPSPPDVIVRTALQLLPIPEHAPDFWARLDRKLDGRPEPVTPATAPPRVLVAVPLTTASVPEPAPTEVTAPAPAPARDPAAALVPPALRRPTNAVLVAVAAAAVVLVAVAGSSLLEQRRVDEAVSAGDPDGAASAELDALVREARSADGSVASSTTTTAPLSRAAEAASTTAVMTWVEDLGTGDVAAAWAAMGPASQDHFGSVGAFEAELSALAEGYGAWSAADPDDLLVTAVQADDDGVVAIVTLVGTVEQEGNAALRTDALPVRVADGEAELEPFASAGLLEVVVPAAAPVEDEDLVIVVPSRAEAPVLRVDDGATVICGLDPGTELTDLEGSSGQRCAYRPEGGLAPGAHTLTVAFRSADGTSISATARRFDAA